MSKWLKPHCANDNAGIDIGDLMGSVLFIGVLMAMPLVAIAECIRAGIFIVTTIWGWL